MSELAPGPSGAGTVVLDLGPGVGALVLRTAPEANGEEIEISQIDAPSGPRTHSQVRPRELPGGPQYAAVYPGLAAGDYTVWLDAVTPQIDVTITEGCVTTAWWPA
ncbi:MAG: hypothetical protein ACLPUO_03720 [Streptosporangiaceae bacterium]|jgi:hypothetical protein